MPDERPPSTHVGDISGAANVAIGNAHVTQNVFAAPARSSGHVVLVLLDGEDIGAVDALRKRLLDAGDDVRLRHADTWTAEDDADLAVATRVLVGWSVHARISARVREGLTRAYALQRPRGFVSGESLDGTRIPANLSGARQTPWLRLAVALAITAFWVGWARQADATPIVPATLCIGSAWALVLAAWAGLPWHIEVASLVHDAAAAVERADVPAALRASEAILHRVFGRTWSWRALLLGAAPTGVVVAFIAVVWATYADDRGFAWREGTLVGFTNNWSVVVGNVILDVAALSFTRTVLPWILRSPTPLRIVVGVTADLLLLVTCTGLAAASNFWGVSDFGRAGLTPLDWVHQVIAWLWLSVSLRLSGSGILRDPYAAQIVGTGIGVVTGSFASMVHLALLGGVAVDLAMARFPSRLAGALGRRLANTKEGAAFWTWATAVAVVCALGARRGPEPVTNDHVWIPVSLSSRCTADAPCTIGSPRDEAGRFGDEDPVSVWYTRDLDVMDREVTRGLWAATLHETPVDASADDAGLVERLRDVHPVVVGDPNLPMMDVSWCDAARFANLLALREVRSPAHIGAGGDVVLEGCERGAAVTTHLNTGPRLPTEAEWEVLARGGTATPWPVEKEALGTIGWTADNHGWVPHVAAAKRTNGFGLYDMTGNVCEWTADAYMREHLAGADPLGEGGAGAAGRVIRGGSFANSTRDVRSAYRYQFHPSDQFHILGFRLVRPPRPQ